MALKMFFRETLERFFQEKIEKSEKVWYINLFVIFENEEKSI